MVLAVTIPHPIAREVARHTYLCANCNQTQTYVLPVGGSECTAESGLPDGRATPSAGAPDNRRREPRAAISAPATLYDKDGRFHAPCIIRDLSRSGARLELFKEATLPRYFLVSMLPDGGGRRLCSKIWQLALIVGVRFVDR